MPAISGNNELTFEGINCGGGGGGTHKKYFTIFDDTRSRV